MQKKISIASLTLFILAFWAVSCSTAQNAMPTSSPVSSTLTPESTTSIINPKEALELMYGKDKTFSTDNKTVMLTREDGYTYWVGVNTLVCYWELGLEKCLVITDWSEGSCHICRVFIGGAVFERTYKGWVLRKLNSNIAILGSFGYVSKGELIRIGDDKYAILLKSGYGNQGFTHTTSTIIAETKNAFGVILEYISTASEIGKWEYGSDSDIYPNHNKENDDYYQIVIRYYGTDQTGKTPPIETYNFLEEKYVLINE